LTEIKKDIPCVELRNVVKRFSEITAVDRVNLKVEQGRVFSLLGPSGCGKTTSLRLVAGLETLDEGDILIDDKVVNDIPPYKRECSMVFQNLAVFPHMTVEKNIAYGLERRKTPKNEVKRRVGEMLELMGLPGMGARFPSQISGGQLQRVALARSLVLRPKILLLDEPLASLDRKLRKEMQIELKRIQREVGITFLYVTHDQKVALSISDVIAVMKDGRLEQVGTPNQIYETPKTGFVADFMGATNIMYGKVISKEDGKILLETENGQKILASEDKQRASEEVAGISIHPEFITVSPAESDIVADNKYRGRVVEIVYQGDFVEVLISLNQKGGLITAQVNSRIYQRNRISPNDEVLVSWNSRRSNILRY
jgi:spermidine/putrescine transport system ATP-binding protein